MADEATIKIEVEGSSGGGGASAASESAGGKLRSQEDILQSILGGEEGLLGSLKNPGKAFKGATEYFLKNYVSDIFGGGGVFSKIIGGGGTGAAGGAAEAAGGVAASGVVASTAGSTATAGGAAAVSAGALATFITALGPAGTAVAGLTLAYGVATAAVLGFAEIVTTLYTSMADAWTGVSAAMQQADALYEVQMTQTKLATEGQVGSGYATIMEQKSELDSELLKIRADIAEILVPAVYLLINLAQIMIVPVKMATESILDIYHLITNIFKWGVETVDNFTGWFTFWSGGEDKNLDKFATLLQNALRNGTENAKSRLNPWENRKRQRYGEK